jgi:hypothetical protein
MVLHTILYFVMAGLVPAIHVLSRWAEEEDVDVRDI